MHINGKELEYSDIDNTFIDEGGERWTAYDLLEFLRSDSLAQENALGEYESVWDVVNMDVQEDYDDSNFEIVGLGDVDESELPSQTASIGDDGLYRIDP